MPVEIMLLPGWFPFHLSKVSYWGRTVLVPLLVLQALKPRAQNPRGVTIDELFVEPPQSIGPPHKAPHQKRTWFELFRAVDIAAATAAAFPERMRKRAIERAVAFVTERLNGEDGLGAIFPAMANSVTDVRRARRPGEPARHRPRLDRQAAGRQGGRSLLPALRLAGVGHRAGLPRAAWRSAGRKRTRQAQRGLDWLTPLQVLDVKGDWIARRPDLRPGGWAFQYANPHYPDLDDTAVVVMAMDRARRSAGAGNEFDAAIAARAGMDRGLQSGNGGWAAFDADNTYDYLNNIPFADHGALLDPPTEDVGARCVSMLAQLGETPENSDAVRRGVDYLRRTQLRTEAGTAAGA